MLPVASQKGGSALCWLDRHGLCPGWARTPHMNIGRGVVSPRRSCAVGHPLSSCTSNGGANEATPLPVPSAVARLCLSEVSLERVIEASPWLSFRSPACPLASDMYLAGKPKRPAARVRARVRGASPAGRGIAEAHGGSIKVASKVGQGSTFTVRLPCDFDRRAGLTLRSEDRPPRAVAACGRRLPSTAGWPAAAVSLPPCHQTH